MPPGTQAFSFSILPSFLALAFAFCLQVYCFRMVAAFPDYHNYFWAKQKREKGCTRSCHDALPISPSSYHFSVQWSDFQLQVPTFLCPRVFFSCLSQEKPTLLPHDLSSSKSVTKESRCTYLAFFVPWVRWVCFLGRMILRHIFSIGL